MTTAMAPMLTADVRDRRAWRRDSLSPRDWLVELSPSCRDELDGVVRQVRRDPLPTLLLTPDLFALSACAALMQEVRARLGEIGLAVVDRVPVERYALEENRILCWLLTRTRRLCASWTTPWRRASAGRSCAPLLERR